MDLKADSNGGPNRLSVPDAVELNLVKDEEGKRKKIRESGGVIDEVMRQRDNEGKESENRTVGGSERRGNWRIVKDVGRKIKQPRTETAIKPRR